MGHATTGTMYWQPVVNVVLINDRKILVAGLARLSADGELHIDENGEIRIKVVFHVE